MITSNTHATRAGKAAASLAVGLGIAWGIYGAVFVGLTFIGTALVVLTYGLQAFSLPTWGVATGAGSAVAFASTLFVLRDSAARAELSRNAILFTKVAGVFIVAVGALVTVVANLPPLDYGASASTVDLNRTSTDLATGLSRAAAWAILFVAPIGFAVVAVRVLALELLARGRSGGLK